jgi:hypothetical protein
MLAVGVVVLIVLGGVVALALTGRGPFAPTAARTSAPGIDQASAVAAPPSPTPTATPTPTPPAADRTGPLVSALPGSPCVDLRGNVKAVGTIVRTLTCDGTTAQEWTFGTDGTVRIDSTWCLASTGIVTTAGTLMTVAPCDTDPVQWRVLADTQIWNPTSGLCLTVAGETGAQLTIATCTGATGQEWTIP